MTRDEIEMLWIKALYESIEAGEKYSRYRFAALVAAAEREACKAIADQYAWSPEAKFIAAKIQERDET